MKRIPKSFSLMGHEIKVHVITASHWDALSEKYPDIEDCVGYWSPKDNVILIKRQKRSQMLHTFAHEMLHAALDHMNHKLSADEVFVDNLGGLLAQALGTAK